MYQFLDAHNGILYVGKAKNLKNRVSSYFANQHSLIGKTKVLVSQVKKIKITIVESELESLLLEAALIKKYTPKYNIRLTDGKAYPLIRITYKAMFPAVLTARRPEDSASLYFGPYPNASAMRMVLRLVRKIFPYQSILNHPKKRCLYNHLGLCPCPPLLNPLELKEYKQTLKHLADFLEGKTKKVLKDLEKERDSYTNSEKFEEAGRLQKQIDAIFYITQPVRNPFEYQTNPNLREDLRQKELESLRDILEVHGVIVAIPHRIECYDNSNIQGTNPTSSMVVLTNGEIDKGEYRKFKVRGIKGPNDFATMQEVFERRLHHTEWPYPNLFVVDGGKGQISSALEVLKSRGVNIPLVGLAKRYETIITSDFQEIHLPKSSPALQLIMRLRDEAHRFAITYHRKLRNKKTFN